MTAALIVGLVMGVSAPAATAGEAVPATLDVAKTVLLDPEGEAVAVTGSGYDPTANIGTRPPLAGQPSGVYVVFARIGDPWKPSAGAPSGSRQVIDQKWALPAAQKALLDPSGTNPAFILLEEDGTFDTTLNIHPAAGTGQYAVITYAAGGAVNPDHEVAVPVSFKDEGTYTPLTPERVLDTRSVTSPLSGAFGPDDTRQLVVAGVGDVPVDATAVVLNVTVTAGSTTSNLRMWPAGAARPNVSNLNWDAGETRANLVKVAVGDGGAVSIRNQTGTAHVLADLAGYYGVDGDEYTAVQPFRMADTRSPTSPMTGALGADDTRELDVVGVGALPDGATAVVANVTVTGGSAGSDLRVWPAGDPKPNTSNLNWAAGQTRANLVVVPLGVDGEISIRNQSGTVHVIVDIVGYYATDGDVYRALVPARIFDTRTDLGLTDALAAGETRSVLATGVGGVPADATAVVLNVTVTGGTAASDLRAWPAGGVKPPVSNLNWVKDEIVPNLVVVKVGVDGRINLRNQSGNVDVIGDVVGYFSAEPAA